MKVVLDTNILIFGIARPGGAPGRIVDAWLQGKFELVVSAALLEEFTQALRYPKVRKLLLANGLSDEDLRDYLEILRVKTVTVDIADVALPLTPPDPRDRHVIAALVASGADFLVTGDRKDLLSLGSPKIVSAADLASRLGAFESLAPPGPDSDR